MADSYPIHPTYTGIALAFTNAEMIADQVLPMINPVGTKKFNWNYFPPEEAMTVPDVTMGRRSTANTIELTATEMTSTVVPWALSDLVPNDDITNAAGTGYDPLAHATETVTDLLVLAREVRVAGLVQDPTQYPSGQKVQLSGANQFSDASSDPFQVMWDALDVPLMRPNVIAWSRSVWNKVATHPKVITKLYGVGSQRGKARLSDLAEELEVSKILIGNARVNTAKKGQAPNLQRAWGKHISMLYINPLANNERGLTFGMTVPQGQRRNVRVIPEPKIGVGGSQRPQVEELLKELIVSPACGYFIQDAVA